MQVNEILQTIRMIDDECLDIHRKSQRPCRNRS